MKKKFCLFKGRHELPNNEGAIFSAFDFDKKLGVKTPLYDDLLYNGGYLYVTGLTPALTQFLIDWVRVNYNNDKKLILMHYNSASKTYWEQPF